MLTNKLHSVSKNGPLRIIWHNFTNSQHLLIILVERDLIQFSIDTIKSFKIWFRTSCVIAIATVVTWRTQTANFRADFEQRVKNCGSVSRSKDCCANICCNLTSHTVLIETLFFFNLTFLFIRQHQLWDDASLRIAMVTASAGTLL